MTIYIGADHRGYNLKDKIKIYLIHNGYEVIDVGNDKYDENDDYTDFSFKVAKSVSEDKSSIGIVICGSGVGVDIVANKVKGIRCSLCFNVKQAIASRNDDNVNVLALSSDFTDDNVALNIVDKWISADFIEEKRFLRRLNKIKEIENLN